MQNPQKDHALGITQGLESHKYSQASGPYWLAEAIKVSPCLQSASRLPQCTVVIRIASLDNLMVALY